MSALRGSFLRAFGSSTFDWGGIQGGFDGTTHNPADYTLSVKCGTLLMNGDRDNRVTLKNIEQGRINLPIGSSFKVFKDTGHESCLKKHPAEWTRAVREWLAAYP